MQDHRVVLARQGKQALAHLSRRSDTAFGELAAVVAQQFGQTALNAVIRTVFGVAIERVHQLTPGLALMLSVEGDEFLSHPDKAWGLDLDIARIEVRSFTTGEEQVRGEHRKHPSTGSG